MTRLKLLPLILWMALLASGPSFGLLPADQENVLVFDANGLIIKSYHVNDWTTEIDATKIHYEDYNAGSPPSLGGTGTQGFSYSAGERWLPNDIGKQYPAIAPSGMPNVSLYSFGEALLPDPLSNTPGVSFSPTGGDYIHSVKVTIKGYPAASIVEIYNSATNAWDSTGVNAYVLTLISSKTMKVRSKDGALYSPEKTMVYTIDQPGYVDTDGDGIPDVIEVALSASYPNAPFDPFISDAAKDTDGDGIPDLDEILRKSNPNGADRDGDGFSDADEAAAATNPLDPASHPAGSPPVYSPRLIPLDTDGDGWSDFDEKARTTDEGDPSDFPTARWLSEVETEIDGSFNGVILCPTCERSMNITEIGGADIAAVTLTANAFGVTRIPRGRPSVLRFITQSETDSGGIAQISNEWGARSYLHSISDPGPGDVQPADWYSSVLTQAQLLTNWLKAYRNLLTATLLQFENGLVIDATETAAMAMVDRALAYVDGLPKTSFYISGRQGYGASGGAVESVELKLQNPAQVPPSYALTLQTSLNDFADSMGALVENPLYKGGKEVANVLANYVSGRDTERDIAARINNLNLAYPVLLGLSMSYSDMEMCGYSLCDLLDAFHDLDGDELANFVETMGLNKGRESNIFTADSDNDGLPDSTDNCPTVAGDGVDFDSDGIGDGCDLDDDKDGLEDEVESALGSGSKKQDTDGDGYPDGVEFEMGLNAANPNDAILYHDTVGSSGSFTTLAFPHPVVVAPVVLANPVSNFAALSPTANLRNVNALSFQHRMDKDAGLAGTMGTERLSCLAVYPAPPGWRNGSSSAGAGWVNVNFPVPFTFGTKPLVFAAIQSENNPAFTLYAEVAEINYMGFKLRVRCNSAQTPPAGYAETVGWVAFMPDDLPVEGEARRNTVGGSVQNIHFSTPFVSAPDLLVQVEGRDVIPLITNVSTVGFDIQIVREAAGGGAIPTLGFSWMALGDVVCADPDHDGICSAVDNSPNVYNPDQVDSDNDGVGNIEDLDADGDGLPDAFENEVSVCGFAPFDGDSDDDGILDGDEDTDGDGYDDGDEYDAGSDIFSDDSTPLNTTPTPTLYVNPPTLTQTPTITETPIPVATSTFTGTRTSTQTPTLTTTPSPSQSATRTLTATVTRTPTNTLFKIFKPWGLLELIKNPTSKPEDFFDFARHWYKLEPTPTPTLK